MSFSDLKVTESPFMSKNSILWDSSPENSYYYILYHRSYFVALEKFDRSDNLIDSNYVVLEKFRGDDSSLRIGSTSTILLDKYIKRIYRNSQESGRVLLDVPFFDCSNTESIARHFFFAMEAFGANFLLDFIKSFNKASTEMQSYGLFELICATHKTWEEKDDDKPMKDTIQFLRNYQGVLPETT